MTRNKKVYVLYYDTENGLGKKVDYINYKTISDAEFAIMEYKRIDRICGNYNEYVIMEV